jgi:hypothetical protein
VTARRAGATAIVTVEVFVSLGLLASLSFKPTEKFPVAVGVPEMTPVEAVRDIPEGSSPELMLQLYPGLPPLALRTATYGVPVMAEGNNCVAIVNGTVPGEAFAIVTLPQPR